MQGTCGNETIAYLALETCGLGLDLGIVIPALFPVWKVHMNWKWKLSTSVMLSLGAL